MRNTFKMVPIFFWLGILAAFCTFQATAQFTTQDLAVSVQEKSPLVVSVGSAVSLSCHLNVGLQIIITHDIEWIKLSRIPGLTNDSVVITRQQSIATDHKSVDHYGINFQSTFSSVTGVLTLRKVDETDDGHYECRVTKRSEGVIEGRSGVDIIVPSDVDALEVKLDNRTITKPTTKVTPGRHVVFCATTGSNPPANISFLLEAQPLKSANVHSSIMREESRSVGAPRFSVEGETHFNVTKEETGGKLEINAGSKTVSTTLIVVDWPTVHCTDVRARESDTHVLLTCDVKHPDVIINDFVWELTDTGIIYSNERRTQDKPMRAEGVNATYTRVTLGLYVVRWGNAPTMFTLTVNSEVGDISGNGYLTTEADEKDATTNRNNMETTTDDDMDKDDKDNEQINDVNLAVMHSQNLSGIFFRHIFMMTCIWLFLF